MFQRVKRMFLRTTRPAPALLSDLPDDVLRLIISLLAVKDAISVAFTCKQLRALALSTDMKTMVIEDVSTMGHLFTYSCWLWHTEEIDVSVLNMDSLDVRLALYRLLRHGCEDLKRIKLGRLSLAHLNGILFMCHMLTCIGTVCKCTVWLPRGLAEGQPWSKHEFTIDRKTNEMGRSLIFIAYADDTGSSNEFLLR